MRQMIKKHADLKRAHNQHEEAQWLEERASKIASTMQSDTHVAANDAEQANDVLHLTSWTDTESTGIGIVRTLAIGNKST